MKIKNKINAKTILWAAFVLHVLSGIIYIWSVISKELMTQYGWTSTQATIPYTLQSIVFAVSMIFAGKLHDRKGPKFTAISGAVLLSVGLLLSALAKTSAIMVITYSIVFGVGTGMIGAGVMPTVVKWFPPSKRGMIIGFLVGGVGLAPILYAPVVSWLSSENVAGIAGSFLALGIFAAVIGIPMAQVIIAPAVTRTASVEHAKRNSDANEIDWKRMIRTKNFYLLWSMFSISATAGLMIISHIVNIANRQAGWGSGFLLVAILAVFNTLGRFIGGSLSDRFGRISVMRVAFLIQMVNMLLFRFYDSPAILAVGVSVCGFCYGSGVAIFPATTSDLFGLKNLGVNNGIMFTGWAFGAMIGPLAAGAIYDTANNYFGAYYIAALLLLIGIGISFGFKRIAIKSKAIEDGVDL